MAGTGFHPEGHIVQAYTYPTARPGQVICHNCCEVDPMPGSDCVDDC